MEGDFISINKALLPLSHLYGWVVSVRNTLFNIGVLKSRAFTIPVISVGNITVGGTGKTPHVEYLIDLLKKQFSVAVLSRGYKRRSKGFVVAHAGTTMPEIGDEPYQMMQKHPDITIAVDKNRCHGIDTLMAQNPKLDVILLDDAFQHRYVKPGINILLVDYHRLIIYDQMLPAGRLREPLSGKDRADIVIVTKCPRDLKPMDYRVITKGMDLYPYQQLFFTTIKYGTPCPIFKSAAPAPTLADLKERHVLLLTGIASPQQMTHDLEADCKSITPLFFSDHHTFLPKDIELINSTFADLPAPKCIITTEKDATRLQLAEGLSDELRNHIYAIPINVCFMLDQTDNFNNQILNYVHKNSRNSILAQAKDDHKPHNGYRAGNRPRTISFRNHRQTGDSLQ